MPLLPRRLLITPVLLCASLSACGSDPARVPNEIIPNETIPNETIEEEPPLQDVRAIAMSRGTDGCSLLGDGTVRCWGRNISGRNGDGTAEPSDVPVAVQGVSNAVAVAAGANHRCALLADGGVTCWGANEKGQLGNGLPPPPPGANPAQAERPPNDPQQSTVPLPVAHITDAIAIAASDDSTCVATRGGTVECWGDLYGLSQRAQLTGVEGITDVAFGLPRFGVHLLTSAGEVLTWSWPEFSDEDPALVTPGPIVPGAHHLEGGEFHLCALTSAGEVWCWGSNTRGVLGVGEDFRASNEPLLVSTLSDVVALGAGWNHNCAVLSDGSAWCWGETTSSSSSSEARSGLPFQINPIDNAVQISSGGDASCAILDDTTARCWNAPLRSDSSNVRPL